MKHIHYIIVLLMALFLVACSLEPDPINYGKDICSHCNMKIMDKRYGAEFVTSKGKIFKFDSGECLIQYINENNLSDNKSQSFVTDFNTPEKLIKTSDATFIISPKLPSPMGAFLTAFSKSGDAKQKVNEFGGEIYDWNSVSKKILNKN